jgi:tRNA-dihydrouridine synthase
MIGRGAQGNPWLFSRIAAAVTGSDDPGPPTIEERRDVLRRHVGLVVELKGGPRLLHEVRKACAWYARGLYGSARFRVEVQSTPGVAEAVAVAEDYFAQLLERRSRLGLAADADRVELESARPDRSPAGDAASDDAVAAA